MTASQFTDAVKAYVNGGEAYLYGSDTDWFEQVTRTPVSHKHSLAVAGGSDKFSHRTVLNIEQNQGILRKNDVSKYLFKTNIHQEALQGWLTFDYNLSYAKRNYNGTRSGIFRQAFFHNPTEPVLDPDDKDNGGYFTITAMDYYNPVAMLNERNGETAVDMIGVNGRATLNILPVKGLKWDNFISYGITRRESRASTAMPANAPSTKPTMRYFFCRPACVTSCRVSSILKSSTTCSLLLPTTEDAVLLTVST